MCFLDVSEIPFSFHLVFTPNMKHDEILAFSKTRYTSLCLFQVNGVIRNNKRDLTLLLHATNEINVNMSSGPLSYKYRLYQIKLHYGRQNTSGSEHRIDGKAFAGEVRTRNLSCHIAK